MNTLNYIKFLPFFLSLFLILFSAFNNGQIIFPIDDAYIYFQQSYLLSKGSFLQFSNNDLHANACTSFIYYIIYTIFWFITNLIDIDLENQIQIVSVFNLFFNLFLFYFYLILIQKLFFSEYKKNYLSFSVIISVVPVYYVFFIGLETGLTTLLVLSQFLFLYKGKNNLFLTISIIASLNRPENLVLNFVLIIIFLILNRKIKKTEVLLLILLAISLLVVPSINYWAYSEIKTNSAARVGWGFGNILRLPGNIYDFIGSIYQNPDFISKKFDTFFEIIKLTLNLLLYYGVFRILLKIYSKISLKITKDTFFELLFKIKNNYRLEFLAIIFVIFYAITPLILSFTGEWSRYVVPVIPIFLIFCFKIFNPNKLILSFLLMLNLIMFPFYLVSNLNSTHIIKKLHFDLASKVKLITRNSDITATTAAGYLSLFTNGKIIDVYGLGTARYSVLDKNDIKSVYELVNTEGFTYLLTFNYGDETKTYMDLGHFKKALPDSTFTIIKTGNVDYPVDGSKIIFSFIKVN